MGSLTERECFVVILDLVDPLKAVWTVMVKETRELEYFVVVVVVAVAAEWNVVGMPKEVIPQVILSVVSWLELQGPIW